MPLRDEVAVDDDDRPDELEADADDGERVYVGRVPSSAGESVGSIALASLYRPSLLRKS